VRLRELLALGLLLATPLPVAGGSDDGNPHRMSNPDDSASCAFCHQEDMRLSASLLDTCLTCHAITEHAGSQEHVRASPAAVARLQVDPLGAGAQPRLPLTPERTIWCGTCHLYHDPQVKQEALLPQPWLPPMAGMSLAVRDAVASRWGDLAAKYAQPLPVASFAERGIRWLRLPVSDGQLCAACHHFPTGKGP
jgi:hypothetical protein